MDTAFRDRFQELWARYFPGAALPLACFYTDQAESDQVVVPPRNAHQCLIGVLNKARQGRVVAFGDGSFGCNSGARNLGFPCNPVDEAFCHFLSSGLEGEVEGERCKKSPEIVRRIMDDMPPFGAAGKYLVFKRWDLLTGHDRPGVVIFFAEPDVLAGLFSLAGFDETDRNAVICPFGAGCAAIVQFPFVEAERESPRAVIGMFDISARPFVGKNELTFAAPWSKFRSMAGNMEESFLITPSWRKIRKRLK